MALAGGAFLDLDTVVKDWSWREYDRTATKRQRQLREKEKRKQGTCLNARIDWSEVKFHDVTIWPQIAEEEFSIADRNENAINTDTRDMGKANASVLFRTKFTNDTDDPQEYTMRTEKTTSSSCSTEVESGYTHGVEMSVNLKTPCEIFEANAGYHREMSLTNIDGECFEEEVTWGVESMIKVKANHVADAQLVVDEKKYGGDFEIVSKIRGTVYITFTNIRDNNSAVKMVSNDIADIVKRHVEMQRRIGEPMDHVTVEEGLVTVHTKGKCQFRFGVKQEVMVHQEPIKKKWRCLTKSEYCLTVEI